MEKQQIIDQLVEHVKKTCEENEISIFMLTGYDEGDRIASAQVVEANGEHLFNMFRGIMRDSPDIADVIGHAHAFHFLQKLQSPPPGSVEEFLREFRRAMHSSDLPSMN